MDIFKFLPNELVSGWKPQKTHTAKRGRFAEPGH